MRNKLMIGVAAIALVAGTGLASAQGNKDHAAPPAASGAAGASKMDQGASKMDQGASKMDQGADKSAQDMKANPESQSSGRAAEEEGHGKGKTNKAQAPSKSKNAEAPSKSKNAEAPSKSKNAEAPSKTNNAQNAEPSKSGKESTTAEQKGGATGKTSTTTAETHGGGANVKLSSEQRTKIQKIVINEHNAPRVAHVDFDIRVGTVIPRGKVHYVPIPSTIVEIEPEWRGFMYFIVGSQIVIVEPDSLRIVAVIAA